MTIPPLAPDAELLSIGAGVAYINPHDDAGNPTGYFDIGDCNLMELTTEDTTLIRKSSRIASRPTYKKILTERSVRFRLSLAEWSKENLALLLMGSNEVLTQTADAVVDEPVATDVVLGRYYRLAKFGPYTSVSLKKAPATALTLDTDWRWIDQNIGIIQLLTSAASIATGDDLLASYTPTAYSAINAVAGGTKVTKTASLLYVPDNTTGPNIMYEFWKLSFSPDGSIGLISNEWAEAAIVGECETDIAGTYGGSATYPLYRAIYMPV